MTKKFRMASLLLSVTMACSMAGCSLTQTTTSDIYKVSQEKQAQIDRILEAVNIDDTNLTEFDDDFIRRIVEQVTVLSKDKIEVRFIGGFSKVGDIPNQ